MYLNFAQCIKLFARL